MHWLFPKETTRYITMLREPADQFESVFSYYGFGKRFQEIVNATSPMEKFLQNADLYLEKKVVEILNCSKTHRYSIWDFIQYITGISL